MRWGAVVLLLVAAGCGGDPPRDALEGTNWSLAQGATCGAGADFDRAGGYKFLDLCQFSDGTYGMRMEAGSYYVSGNNTLHTLPEQATCPADTSSDAVTFTISGSILAIQTANGLLAFERNTATADSSAAIRYGCFDAAGNFTPSPLVSL